MVASLDPMLLVALHMSLLAVVFKDTSEVDKTDTVLELEGSVKFSSPLRGKMLPFATPNQEMFASGHEDAVQV